MFECERCGSSYSATHLGVENCPRCQLRDQVQAPLAFRAFRLAESEPATTPASNSGNAVQPPLTTPAEAS